MELEAAEEQKMLEKMNQATREDARCELAEWGVWNGYIELDPTEEEKMLEQMDEAAREEKNAAREDAQRELAEESGSDDNSGSNDNSGSDGDHLDYLDYDWEQYEDRGMYCDPSLYGGIDCEDCEELHRGSGN